MYNRPTSLNRYQEPTVDSVNLKERQLYLQSSSINPLTGQPLKDQVYPQSQTYNQNLDKKVALQASSINPLTGAPVVRNQQYYAPQSQSAQGDRMYNDPHFQKNLNKFFGADDPNEPIAARIKQKRRRDEQQNYEKQQYQQQRLQNDPNYQKNLNKFYGADDPNESIAAKIKQKRKQTYQDNQYQQGYQSQYQQQPYQQPQYQSNYNQFQVQQNDPHYQKNLNKFFGADDPNEPIARKIKNKRRQEQQVNYGSNGYQNDPSFQRNLVKFYGADDPNPPIAKKIKQRRQDTQKIPQYQPQLPNDPYFQKNLNKFFGADDPNEALASKIKKQRNGGQQENRQNQSRSYDTDRQGIQGAIQPALNRQPKILAVADSSSASRQAITNFFRTRGVDDFDVFTSPGGVFSFSNPVWDQCLKAYIDTMSKQFYVKEIYLISSLDQNTNAKIYINQNDRKSHHIALEDLKLLLVNKYNLQIKINGILIDQRGASEKVF
ncbi:hypothetical protein pb186bvf_017466 [Paramecium bursaria]